MRKLIRNAVAIAPILAPVAAYAHPGPHREHLAAAVVHAFAWPDHLSSAAILAAWAAALVWAFRWSMPQDSNSR